MVCAVWPTTTSTCPNELDNRLQFLPDDARERLRGGRDLEMQFRLFRMQLAHDLDQDREKLPHLARPAPGKEADQMRRAERLDPFRAQVFDHGMADENRAQTRLLVELGLEGKNAEHQIEPASPSSECGRGSRPRPAG